MVSFRLSFVLGMAISLIALGHGGYASALTGRHGGQIQRLGKYEVELVLKGMEIALYLSEDNREVDVSLFQATVIITTSDNELRVVRFNHTRGNGLTAEMSSAGTGSLRATVSLTTWFGTKIGKLRYSLDGLR